MLWWWLNLKVKERRLSNVCSDPIIALKSSFGRPSEKGKWLSDITLFFYPWWRFIAKVENKLGFREWYHIKALPARFCSMQGLLFIIFTLKKHFLPWGQNRLLLLSLKGQKRILKRDQPWVNTKLNISSACLLFSPVKSDKVFLAKKVEMQYSHERDEN